LSSTLIDGEQSLPHEQWRFGGNSKQHPRRGFSSAPDDDSRSAATALGKPVWILNRFDACWRWLLDHRESPWYPTARLYRQDGLGDWRGVIQRVRQDLFSSVLDAGVPEK
jgi:hypothetical protein